MKSIVIGFLVVCVGMSIWSAFRKYRKCTANEVSHKKNTPISTDLLRNFTARSKRQRDFGKHQNEIQRLIFFGNLRKFVLPKSTFDYQRTT